MNCELVKFPNTTGMLLDGLYFTVENPIATVIHVHGSFGNFYQNSFIKVMGSMYTRSNIDFLTFNLTQHDGICEAVRCVDELRTWEYIGYSVSSYATCLNDIQGAIDFVDDQHSTIFLQGHSLGCNRILKFIASSNNVYPIILLSPTDSMELQRRWIYPETIQQQIERLVQMNDRKQITVTEHGVLTPNRIIDESIDAAPYIPISVYSLLSILLDESFDLFNFAKVTNIESNSGFVYLGEKDEYQTIDIETCKLILREFFVDVEFLVLSEGTHSFLGQEDIVIDGIIEWIIKKVKGGKL